MPNSNRTSNKKDVAEKEYDYLRTDSGSLMFSRQCMAYTILV
jgi:hypothetical protein